MDGPLELGRLAAWIAPKGDAKAQLRERLAGPSMVEELLADRLQQAAAEDADGDA